MRFEELHDHAEDLAALAESEGYAAVATSIRALLRVWNLAPQIYRYRREAAPAAAADINSSQGALEGPRCLSLIDIDHDVRLQCVKAAGHAGAHFVSVGPPYNVGIDWSGTIDVPHITRLIP